MAKSAAEEAGIPKEVADEVERIKLEEGEPTEAPVVDSKPERVALPQSRRAKEREEEKQAIADARERAERAEAAVEEIRRSREEDRANFARIEGMLAGQAQSRRTTVDDDKPRDGDDELPGWYQKQVREATALLSEQKIDEYHEKMGRANQRLAKESRGPAAPVVQQQPQKPVWVSAVESKFPDVLMHANGVNAVIAFAQLDPGAPGPEKLEKAFLRARKELGLGGDEKPATNNTDKQRQMLSGGPVNGTGRASSGKGGKQTFVNVPKNYKQIAAQAGMSPDDYIKSYAAMNPNEISRE